MVRSIMEISPKVLKSAANENMQSVTYQGKVDGLIVEIELLSWKILGLNPPKDLIKKQQRYAASGQMSEADGGPNWLLWGLVGLAGIGGAAVALGGGGDGAPSSNDIGEPPTFPAVP